MIYQCDNCNYVFEAEKDIEQCPDCGKYAIRNATEKEEKDYRRIQDELRMEENKS